MTKLSDKQKWELLRQSREALASKQADGAQKLEEVGVAYLVETTEQLSSDSAAEFLKNFDAPTQKQILSGLPEAKLNDIIELLSYPAGSTGSVMAKEFMAVPENITVADAIERLYQLPVERRGKAPYVYVTGPNGELRGAIKTSDLIFNAKEKKLGEIMSSPVDFITADKPEIDAARFMQAQHHLALPVVNDKGLLTGVVSANSIVQIMKDQADSDMAKMVGTSMEELQAPSILGALKLRMPWLLFTIASGFLCAWIADEFQRHLVELAVLFLFIPLVLGLSESIGIQGATIVVRNITQGTMPFAELRGLFVKEGGAGFLIGLVCSTIVGGIALVWKGSPMLGFAIGGSLVATIGVSACIGLILPVIFKAIKIDPAIASGPLVLALCDIQALLIYFNLAGKILS